MIDKKFTAKAKVGQHDLQKNRDRRPFDGGIGGRQRVRRAHIWFCGPGKLMRNLRSEGKKNRTAVRPMGRGMLSHNVGEIEASLGYVAGYSWGMFLSLKDKRLSSSGKFGR